MRIAVFDDEKIYHSSISHAIDAWKKSSDISTILVDCYVSSEDLLYAWENSKHYDLVFLDIEIANELNGIALAQQLRSMDQWVQIVFVTNYSKYASAGYGVNALRYLQKPILAEQIYECLNIAYSQWKLRSGTTLIITNKSSTFVLPHHLILYIESSTRELLIHKTDHSTIESSRCTIPQMLDLLNSNMFIQCHRSIIVNISYVRRFTMSELILADGTVLPIGKKYKSTFVEQFNHFYQGGAF